MRIISSNSNDAMFPRDRIACLASIVVYPSAVRADIAFRSGWPAVSSIRCSSLSSLLRSSNIIRAAPFFPMPGIPVKDSRSPVIIAAARPGRVCKVELILWSSTDAQHFYGIMYRDGKKVYPPYDFPFKK